MTEREFLERINTHKGTIYHLLRLYVTDPEDREDIKQEIILQAWKSKDNFLNQSSFNTWLYKLSLYTILTSKKKWYKINTVNLEEAEGIAAAGNPAYGEGELLYRCIAGLDDLSKTVITMHLDGFSNPEIAHFIGVSINHLNVKLHRIKEKITQHLTGRNYGNR
jgi:RNA polymerase sigma-70 factor (ECF subfamily)